MAEEMIAAEKFNNSSYDSTWNIPPAVLQLKTGEIHVWLADLNEVNAVRFSEVISDDEQNRASRFRLERDRTHFIAARGFLRTILGKYLKMSAAEIHFEYDVNGKPFLKNDSPFLIKFNLSHSGGLALFAFTQDGELGVDLEQINSAFADEDAARYCLTPLEMQHFQTLSGRERDLFFFSCWTRKEAFLKACGTGLSIEPNQIESLSLSIQNLPPIPGFAAALVTENPNPKLHFWQALI